jgi:hypothetical protein
MALVSRIAVLGKSSIVQTAEHAVEGVFAQATTHTTATAGAEPSHLDAAYSEPSHMDGQVTLALQTVSTPPPVTAHTDLAAASPTMAAGHVAITIAFALVLVGAAIDHALPQRTAFHVSSAIAAYGGLLVFASAIERVLEPFSHFLPGRHATNKYEQAVVALTNHQPGATLTLVAHAKAKADRAVADRGIIMWGLATAVSTVIAAASGLYLLRMIASPEWAPSVPTWVDALITGVVVGSGTKPLHDLIAKAQTPKDS